ncbi:MAG: phage antirepressor KilAC domain-containing protein [Ewingella sp.]|nr:phage antirepressor KilAC domain-containing protein [Ewingella sp.]
MTHSSVGVAVPKISVTMSSRDVAELTEKRHPDVKRDVEVMLTQLNEDVSSFARIYTDSMNRNQTEYVLDRDHVECLLAGYSAVLRMKVIRRLRELESGNVLPQSLPEALRLAADLAEAKQKLETELAIAAPKAEFVDRYVTASGSMGFRQVCKLLKAKEPEFRLFLIDKKIMYRLAGAMTPYQPHIDSGRFEVKTGTSDVSNHAFSQAKFTPKGIKWVAGLWADHLRQEAA